MRPRLTNRTWLQRPYILWKMGSWPEVYIGLDMLKDACSHANHFPGAASAEAGDSKTGHNCYLSL